MSNYKHPLGLNFADKQSEDFFKSIEEHVIKAVKSMVYEGRGIVIAVNEDTPREEPFVSRKNLSLDTPPFTKTTFESYNGSEVTAQSIDHDLMSDEYMKPFWYQTRANRMESVHHSRVFDFVYHKPPELDAYEYEYGGIPIDALLIGKVALKLDAKDKLSLAKWEEATGIPSLAAVNDSYSYSAGEHLADFNEKYLLPPLNRLLESMGHKPATAENYFSDKSGNNFTHNGY